MGGVLRDTLGTPIELFPPYTFPFLRLRTEISSMYILGLSFISAPRTVTVPHDGFPDDPVGEVQRSKYPNCLA
jgi:hypothetical protein